MSNVFLSDASLVSLSFSGTETLDLASFIKSRNWDVAFCDWPEIYFKVIEGTCKLIIGRGWYMELYRPLAALSRV